jgi:DNA invertase Pin-like site-specific DNA recombinase
LDYAREGDAIVVVGIDRFGRNAAEVMTTIRELGERGIVLRSLREGIDTPNATGRMVAGVLASLAELELALGRERRSAAREARRARGQSIGRPKALDESKGAPAQRMHASGESASTIAAALGVSRATSTACWRGKGKESRHGSSVPHGQGYNQGWRAYHCGVVYLVTAFMHGRVSYDHKRLRFNVHSGKQVL